MTEQHTKPTFDCPVCGNPLYYSRSAVISCCYCRHLIVPPDRRKRTPASEFVGERRPPRPPREPGDFRPGDRREAHAPGPRPERAPKEGASV